MARKDGRQRRWKTADDLLSAWTEYKEWCDGQTVAQTMFSQKDSKFHTQYIPHPITYTVKGFCVHNGMTERNFYETYANENGEANKDDAKFPSVIACMKEECEIDARKKFENGTIDSRLAGLWMSNHGYTTQVEQKVEANVSPIVIKNDITE